MGLHWLATSLRTGAVLAEFPDMDAKSGVKRTLGQSETATAKFPVANLLRPPPAEWLTQTTPLKTMLVAVNDNADPLWGGFVNKRRRIAGTAVDLSLVTPEGYAARRFVRTKTQRKQVDRVDIAADLLATYVVGDTAGQRGLPGRIDATSGGILADLDVKDSDDKSIYSILQDLGMEWTVSLELQHNPERYTLVWKLAERIGQPATPGLGPAVTLSRPGNLITAEMVEDYSEGRGANDVMATSSGQGDVRPQSTHQARNQIDRPTVELRESAGDNITRLGTLNLYAFRTLAARANGSNAYTLSLSVDHPDAAAIGMGDDVGLDLAGPEFPEHPRTTLRTLGMQIDKTTYSPVLAGDDAN